MQTRSREDTWYFDDNSDNLTGWTVRTADGAYLGKVARLMVNTDSGYASAVVLDNGRELSAHDISIGDRELMFRGMAATAKKEEAARAMPAAATVALADKPNLALVEEKREALKEKVEAKVEEKREALKEIRDEKRELREDRREAREEKREERREARVEKREAIKEKIEEKLPATRAAERDDIVLQLIDEDLEVGKRAYDAGGVHLETHVVSEPFAKEVRLKDEHVTIQRSRVDKTLDATAANAAFHDESYEVKATAEVPVVKKVAHVVEEVVVSKKAFDHDQTIRDTIRHMEADITELRASEALQGGRR